MAAAKRSGNPSRNGFTTVRVGSVRCSAISIQHFWRPISIQQMITPRVPGTLYPGKVRRRACEQHMSEFTNVQMRGRPCPKAWASPMPERVCSKVRANPHKSPSCSSREEDWKRGRNAWNPLCFSQGSHQSTKLSAKGLRVLPLSRFSPPRFTGC
jgi:hypothetical protein